MATSTDPLRRDAIGVVAQLPTARLQAPVTNSALQLADALKDVTPEARQAMQGFAQDQAEKQRAQAKKDAIQASGALLADAVRAGKLRATQNPWYVQAYNRESAAIRAQDSLQKLQTESATWDEQDDPQAFAKRWRDEVGKVAEGYSGEDYSAGFNAAEAAVTSQVLQTNVARNTARIQTERQQNLGALATDALQSALRTKGGAVTPNEAWEALLPARQQWFATGGDVDGWNKIVISAVTSTAYGARDKSLLDLLKAPEIAHGPSDAGGVDRIGAGQGYIGAVTTHEAVPPTEPAPAGQPAQAPSTVVRAEAPRQRLQLAMPVEGGRISSGFGARKAPVAGASTYHEGIDIALPQGTPVKAQSVGKVVFAGRVKGYGNQVRVDYGNGVVASYSHLASFNVAEGDIVHTGQAVAAVGRTGVATGPHLHYMLEVNGKRVDPSAFRGNVGGTFETKASADVPAPESLVGFPGQDQPFTAGTYQQPANQYGRGPSLYGMPGVADQVESDRYRISEAAMAATTERMRAIDAQRTARGYEAQDYLLNKYGTGLLTGSVTRQTIISDLSGQGYSAPEIAKAMNFIHSGLSDSVAVANAQVQARQQDPGVAKAILDLQVEGVTNGFSPGYEDRVGSLVLSGALTRDDAAGMLGGALTRTRQQEAEAKADQREARAEAKYQESQRTVSSYSDLRDQGDAMAGYVVTQAVKLHPEKEALIRDPKMRGLWERTITDAMGAWLVAHPKDWDGALAAGQQAAATLLQNMRAPARKPAPANPNQGGNPRR